MCCRNRNLFCVLLLFVVSKTSIAQTQKFPYQARVIAPEAYVRSGGGDNFYPTLVLEKDAVVTVRRHDPGGWYKIDPPKGSFSWIATSFVRQTSSDTGVVSTADAIVAVGSQFGDETTVWQRRMLEGEEVKLLGQKLVETAAGPRKMYKISPPTREYRWISGRDILPLDQQALASRDSDPYAIPSDIIKQNEVAESERPAQDSPTAAPLPKYSPSKSLARLKKIRQEKLALRELDREFRVMLLGHPSAWQLDLIEQKYLRLQETSTYAPLAGQIDLRYPAINRYRIRKAEFDDFQRLTSETEKRDAQLLASQYGIPTDDTAATNTEIVSNQSVMNQPALAGAVTGPLSGSNELVIPEISIADSFNSGVFATPNIESNVTSLPQVAIGNSAGESGSPGPSATTAVKSQFVGAGFVQRGITSESKYVLMSPAGKVLAHLTPEETVDLEQHIGQAVGVKGNRKFDVEASTDRITVSGLERVRLRQ